MSVTLVDLQIVVVDNLDRLTAENIHLLYHSMMEEVTDRSRELLRANAEASVVGSWPRPTPGAMVEHVDSEGPIDAGAVMESHVGVRPVPEARRPIRPYASMFREDPADYPIFKDKGTGLYGDSGYAAIFSPTGGTMRFEGRSGELIFRKHVEGQEGAHFSDKTYEEILAVVLPAEEESFERRVKGLAT